MSYFAQIDEAGIVLKVIVASKEYIDAGKAGDPAMWIETAKDASIRKNFAGKGFTYDKLRDAFIPPKPFARQKWVLNEKTANWMPPKDMPNDGKFYIWDDEASDWIENKNIRS